jgi:hypothetical protein
MGTINQRLQILRIGLHDHLHQIILLILILFLDVYSIHAQKLNAADSLIIGNWKGSSICQVKNSPCHDETVICHITKIRDDGDIDILMNKIVDGKEEGMGVLVCSYDRKTGLIHSNASKGTWTFILRHDNMDGRLIYEGKLYRIIHLSRAGGKT